MEKAEKISQLTEERDSIYQELLSQSDTDHQTLLNRCQRYLYTIYVRTDFQSEN